MPVNSTSKTMWEDQAKAVYLLDPATGLPSALPLHIELQAIDPDTNQPVSLPADPLTGDLEVIDTVHAEIHGGDYFSGSFGQSVNNGLNLDFRIVIAAADFHWNAMITSGGQVTITLYEDANLSGGTSVQVVNHYRAKGDGNKPFTLFHTPVVTGVGNPIVPFSLTIPGGTTGATRIGGGLRLNDEMILKAGATYLLRINNSSGGAIVISAHMGGYRH